MSWLQVCVLSRVVMLVLQAVLNYAVDDYDTSNRGYGISPLLSGYVLCPPMLQHKNALAAHATVSLVFHLLL